MSTPIEALVSKARVAIANAPSVQDLETVRVAFLGKKGHITQLLKSVGSLPASERPLFGEKINSAKQAIDACIQEKLEALQRQAVEKRLSLERVDATLPVYVEHHGLHPLTLARERIEDIFMQLGFSVAQGPEVETDFYNFTALNIPEDHPARASHDTFYTTEGTLLRTHTSAIQIRVMQKEAPPLRIISSGRVYRRDLDATHSPMFHQLEGLFIDKDIAFADLKGILQQFLEAFFEQTLTVRLRPSFFPFTEPSAELDISCVRCKGQGCRLCKQTGWLEVLGCGMVHPAVLSFGKIDTKAWQGFAFGLGVERLAMLYYGVDDLRIFFENDLRFLSQFQGL